MVSYWMMYQPSFQVLGPTVFIKAVVFLTCFSALYLLLCDANKPLKIISGQCQALWLFISTSVLIKCAALCAAGLLAQF